MASFAHLVNPWAFFRARFQTWFENRLPLTDQVTLTQRTVYILPTRPGAMLGVTLLVLLVASINYQLNLGYLLTFLLGGCALVGMHVCHATLRGVALHLMSHPPAFARSSAFFDLQLTNDRKTTRYGIGVRALRPDAGQRASADKQAHWVWTDLPPQGSSTVRIAFSPPQRGLHRVPTVTVETRFPLGTFRVWTVWRPAAQCMVYPEPEAHPPNLPAGEPRSDGAAAAARSTSTGEFDGVRSYRRGDPMKWVVWKKAAKADAAESSGGALVVRDTQHSDRYELWLDFMLAGSGETEHKLSRLCAWVLMADKLGVAYGLRLPGLCLPPAAGEAHRRACLEALALC